MTEAPTMAELLGAVIILGGLLLSLWGLVDDIWDLIHVYRFGEMGGPRWVSAIEHFFSNLSFLGAWVCILGVLSIAIYLPSRTDQPSISLSNIAGWLRFGSACFFLLAQIHKRIGRWKLTRLPLESWERMLAAMFDGLTLEERTSLSVRLLHATGAVRRMGHLIANDLQLPVAILDEIACNETLPASVRAEAVQGLAMLERVAKNARALHIEAKDLEQQP